MFRRVLALLLVVVAALFAAGCDDDDGGGGGPTASQTEEICKLAASGLELLAQNVRQGDEVAALIKIVGPGVCGELAKSLVEDPFEPVAVEVELPDGENTYFSGTGEELIAPAPEPEPAPSIDIDRLLACVQSYSIEFLVRRMLRRLHRTLTQWSERRKLGLGGSGSVGH